MRSSVVAVLLLCLSATTNGAEQKGFNAPAVSLRGATEKTVPLRTHSLYARTSSPRLSASASAGADGIERTATAYVDSDLQNRWFDFGGSTIINTKSARPPVISALSLTILSAK